MAKKTDVHRTSLGTQHSGPNDQDKGTSRRQMRAQTPFDRQGDLPDGEHTAASQGASSNDGYWATALQGLGSAVDRQHEVAANLIKMMAGILGRLDELLGQQDKFLRQQDELLSTWKITARRQAAFADEQLQIHRRSIDAIARIEALAVGVSRQGDASAATVVTALRKKKSAEKLAQRTKPTQALASKQVHSPIGQSSPPDQPKRRRRTKAEMQTYKAELQIIEALGLKRGRGRPKKGALTSAQIAAKVAEANNS